jgi:hypothetical protein
VVGPNPLLLHYSAVTPLGSTYGADAFGRGFTHAVGRRRLLGLPLTDVPRLALMLTTDEADPGACPGVFASMGLERAHRAVGVGDVARST